MMTMIDEERLAVISAKIEKLMRLSTSPNEHEAALAAEKVQELLSTYNLDMLQVEKHTQNDPATRKDERLKGGLYKWQRSLWKQVAENNWCMYWSHRGLAKGSSYEHQVLGSKINVLAARLMAEYLEQAVERITRDAYNNVPQSYYSKAAIAFREGMADRICSRLRTRRYEEREAAKKAKAEAAARGDDKALTILDVDDAEKYANEDYRNGWAPGTAARKAAERKAEHERWIKEWEDQRAAEKAKEEAFKRDFPEEWAAREAKRAKDAEREAKRQARNESRRRGRWHYKDETRHSDYYKGYDRGNEVSLDRQVGSKDRKKLS